MNKTLKKLLKPILLPPYRWLKKDRIWLRKFLSITVPIYATKRLYKRAIGKRLNLKNPITLNEKCLWLKFNTYYNNPLITECCDKYLVRNYVKRVGYESILNELLGVWDDPEKINFDNLPNKFVLKCNHGAGYNIICKDKSKLDIVKTKKQLKSWLQEDYWKLYAEMQYKFIHKKIIAEKFIESENDELPDYKIFCINGKADCIMICTERETGDTKFYYFDRNLIYKPEYYYMHPTEEEEKQTPTNLSIPNNVNKMFEIAEKLANPFPFVRVDLYESYENIIFGELTFLSLGGFDNDGYATSKSNIDLTKKIITYSSKVTHE